MYMNRTAPHLTRREIIALIQNCKRDLALWQKGVKTTPYRRFRMLVMAMEQLVELADSNGIEL